MEYVLGIKKMRKENKKDVKKRAEIAEPMGSEVANIIISVVALVILIFVGVVVYMIFTSEDTAERNAEDYVKKIKNGMDVAKENPGTEVLVDLEGPGGYWWWVIAWPYDDLMEKPRICDNNRKSWCVCLCERPSNARVLSNYNIFSFGGATIRASLEMCNNGGKCENFYNPVKTIIEEENIPILVDDVPIQIKIKYIDSGKGYEIVFVK